MNFLVGSKATKGHHNETANTNENARNYMRNL